MYCFYHARVRKLVDEEKSTANGVRMMSAQGGKVVGPWMGGQLMEKVSLGFPALLGGGIHAVTAALTILLLKGVDSSPGIEGYALRARDQNALGVLGQEICARICVSDLKVAGFSFFKNKR